MINDTPQDQTKYCLMCEDAANKILELEQRVKVLTDAIKRAENVLRYRVNPAGHTEMIKIGNTHEWTRAIHAIEHALNQTPQQTAAQINRGS